MEPLNKKERTEAFLKVLALFAVSVILVAIPMYYAFKMPSVVEQKDISECESLRSELANLKEYDKQFLMKTDSARRLYNEFTQENENYSRDILQQRYTGTTIEMEDFSKTIRNDSIKPMLFSNVIFSFNELFINRSKIFTMQEKIDELEGKKKEPTEGEVEEKPTLRIKFYNICKEAYTKNSNSKRLAGKEVGLSEKTFSAIVKELKL